MESFPPEENSKANEKEQELLKIKDRAIEILADKKLKITNVQQSIEMALKEAGSLNPKQDMRMLRIMSIIAEEKQD